jgi:ribonuclease HI
MDWIKLNVDGCSNGNLGTAGAGGILRDNLGTWCKGFAINIGICSPVKVELWAVITGLELAWSVRIRRVILELDFSLVVQLITRLTVKVDVNYTRIQRG